MLLGADLSDAQLQGAHLDGALLVGADLSRAGLQGADLRRATLEVANLSDAQLQGANLDGARLVGADLSRAGLQGADLRRAALEGANFRGAALWRVLVVGVWEWDLADLRGSSVQPLVEADVDVMITAVAAAFADERDRKETVEWLTRALRDDDRPARPAFPHEWQSQPNVMFEPGDPEPEPYEWGPRKWATEQAYDEDLAKFLGDLFACREVPEAELRELAEARTRGAALRAFSISGLAGERLAARLTGPDCPQAKGLPDDLRSRLEQLAAGGTQRGRDPTPGPS